MGQVLNVGIAERVEYHENSNNGFMISNSYLPDELLAEILVLVDYRSLLRCQLVCKHWNMLLRNYVWRKKAEMIIRRPLPFEKNMPWTAYYVICRRRPFDRNLIKNHSGRSGLKKNWRILKNGGDKWKVECPPIGAPPLPSDEPVFEGGQHCFVASHGSCSKVQIVDLVSEGLTPHLLDLLQPPITVSEWYSCRYSILADYICNIQLLNDEKQELDSFQFKTPGKGSSQKHWRCNDNYCTSLLIVRTTLSTLLHFLLETCISYWDSVISVGNVAKRNKPMSRHDVVTMIQDRWKISHVFENYGRGLRTISFYHEGLDFNAWAGEHSTKMAGACVKVNIPKVKPSNSTPSVPLGQE